MGVGKSNQLPYCHHYMSVEAKSSRVLIVNHRDKLQAPNYGENRIAVEGEEANIPLDGGGYDVLVDDVAYRTRKLNIVYTFCVLPDGPMAVYNVHLTVSTLLRPD